jgi:hypothetical protein
MTINYEQQFKGLADQLALEPISAGQFERNVLKHLFVIDDEIGKIARRNRARTIENLLAIFAGREIAGDTTGRSRGIRARLGCPGCAGGQQAQAE